MVVDDAVKKGNDKVVEESETGNMNDKQREKEQRAKSNGPPPYRPPLPFPQRFRKKEDDEQAKKFLEMFKQLRINIPFAEALEQMPKYAKFLKDVLTKKRRFSEFETVALTEECSAILKKKLPPKLKDPGSFSIPCNVGNNFQRRALCDLGASVNLMPSAVFNKLGLGEARPTTVTLLLADRSITHPRGIIENVLVKVDKFIVPADFIVVDCEVDWNIPIILGRPFLATARTVVDVEKGEITLKVNDEQVSFTMNQAPKLLAYAAPCAAVESQGDNTKKNEDELKECHIEPSDPKVFEPDQMVLLYNDEFKQSSGRFKFRWYGPFTVVHASNFKAVELENDEGERFKVSGQLLKHYEGSRWKHQEAIIAKIR